METLVSHTHHSHVFSSFSTSLHLSPLSIPLPPLFRFPLCKCLEFQLHWSHWPPARLLLSPQQTRAICTVITITARVLHPSPTRPTSPWYSTAPPAQIFFYQPQKLIAQSTFQLLNIPLPSHSPLPPPLFTFPRDVIRRGQR